MEGRWWKVEGKEKQTQRKSSDGNTRQQEKQRKIAVTVCVILSMTYTVSKTFTAVKK